MKHLIKKHIFDIRMGNERKAPAIQDRISEVFRQKLTTVIEEIFNRFSNPNQLIRIDKLELDLGKIGELYLEDELIRKISYQLPFALSEIIAKAELTSHKEGVEITSTTHSNLELLQFYLQNGALPWWHKSDSQSESIETIFQQLLTQKPRATATLLQKIGKQKTVQKRLMFQFSNELLEKVIRLLIPKYALSVNTYINKIQQQIQRQKLQNNITQTALKHQIYTFTLQYIFESDTLFTLTPFKTALKENLTAHFEFKSEESDALFEGLTEDTKTPNATQNLQSQLEILRYFLKEGRLPDWSYIHSKDSLEDVLSHLLDREPQRLLRFFRLINNPHQISQRIVYQFSKETVARLFDLLTHQQASFVHDYLHNLNKIYGFRSGQKPRMEENLKISIFSFFLQKNASFTPTSFNKHVSSQLLQKRIIAEKEVTEIFDLVTARTTNDKQQVETFYQNVSTNTQAPKHPNTTTNPNTQTQVSTQTPKHTSTLIETIEFFLENGRIPSNLQKNLKDLSFNQLFTKFLQEQSINLPSLLHQTFTHENRQKRLIQQLSEKLLRQIIQVLQPDFALQIQDFKEKILQYAQKKPEQSTSQTQYQYHQRSAILRYLLTTTNAVFDLADFEKEMTKRLQQEFGDSEELSNEEKQAVSKNQNTYRRFTKTSPPNPQTQLSTETPKHKRKHSNTKENTLVETIAYFLQYARLPEQIESQWQGLSFEELFVKLLEKQAQKVLPLLQNAAKTAEAQERLILQLSEKTLTQLLQILQPKYATFLQNFRSILQDLYSKEPQLFKTTNDPKILQWQYILAHLFTIQSIAFHPTTFIAKAIQYLAVEGNKSRKNFEIALQKLIQQQEKTSTQKNKNLQNITEALASAIELQKQRQQTPTATQTPPKHPNLTQSVAYFLLNQKRPSKTSPNIAGLSFEELMLQLLKEEPRQIPKLLQTTAENKNEQNTLIQYLSDATLTKLLEKLSSKTLYFAETLRQNLNKLQTLSPQIFTQESSPKKLQWQILLDYALQTPKPNFKEFSTQKITQLTTQNIKDRKEQAPTIEIIQKITQQKTVRTYDLPQAIGYFLRYDRLPKQVKKDIQGLSFEQLFTQLLQKQSRQILALLQQTAKEKTSQKRLIQHLSEKTLEEWVRTLHPNFEGFIATYRLSLQKLQQSKPQIFSRNPSPKMLQWQGIVAYLLNPSTTTSSSSFDTKTFTIQALQNIAPSSKEQQIAFMTELQRTVQQEIEARQYRFYPLGEILEDLVTGEGEKKDEKPNTYRRFSKTSLPNTQTPKHNYQPKPPNTEQNPNTQTQLSTQTQPKTLTESIAYFLQHARLPQNIESEWQGLTFEQLFVKLLETQALKVLPFLRIAARTTEAQERLVFQLSEETLVQLVEILQPQFATFIEEFRALMTRFYEKNGTLFQPINDLQVLQWQAILEYLLAPQTDEFYPTTFITKIIQRLSLKGKEAQQQFAETLQNFLLQQEKTIFYQVLSKHLSSAIALQSEAPPVAKRQPKKPLNIVQAIAYFLLNERLTDHVQDSIKIKGLSFEGLIQKWIQEHPEKVSFFLQRMKEDNTQQLVLIQHLSDGTLVKMLEKVDTKVIRWVEKLRRVLNKLQGQMPHFFAAYKSPRFLQWQLLIAFVLQKTKIDFDSFLAQKMEELTVENTLQEKELILQSLQKVLQKTADSENFNLPQSIGFFLRYERLPQKMEVSIEEKNFEALFTQFLQKQPRQVAPFLQQVLKEREQQTRLIHQLPEDTLRELVQTLQPNFAGFIETFRLAIQKLQQESKSIFQEDADGKELEWEGILTYLLEASTGEFDSKKFVVYSLRVILGQVKVSREIFLESLQEVVKVAIGKREMRFYPLGEVLDETVISDLRLVSGEETTNSLPRDLGGRRLTSDVLKQEFEGSEELIGDSLQMTDEEHDTYRRFSKTSLQTMEYFLEHGRLPERVEESIEGKSFGELFDQFLREEPRKVVPFLKAKAQTSIKQKRLIRALSEAILKEIVVRWQPDFAGFVETFRLAIQKLQQRKVGIWKGSKEGKILQWKGIFKYILEVSTGRFDTKDFTVRALQVIAPKGGLQKEEFLKSLKEVVQEGIDAKEYRFYPLGEVLGTIDGGRLTVDGGRLTTDGLEEEQEFGVSEESVDNGGGTVDGQEQDFEISEELVEDEEHDAQRLFSKTSLQTMEYFLEHGRLPERMEESIEGKSFEELFNRFLAEEPRKVIPFLKAKAQTGIKRERLIRALSELTLKEMVIKWQPDFAGFVETFRLAVKKLQQRKRGALKGRKEGKVLQWEGILKYLLETSTGRFDTKDFTVRALQVIAPKSGLQKEEFLKSLKEVVQEEIDAKEYRFYPLGEILAKLVIGDLRWVTGEETTDSLPQDLGGQRLTVDKEQEQEFGNLEESTDEEQDLNTQIQLPTQTQDPKTKRGKEEETEESRREWALEDLLVYFLEYGLLPKRMPRKWRNSTFEGLFVELLERSSKKTLPLLRKEVKANEAQERLIKQLSDKTLSQLLKVVLGTNVVFVEKFMMVLKDLYAADSTTFKVENSRMLQWRSVIAYLVEGDAGFDRLGFLAFAIRYLAKMSSRSAVELLAQIQAVVSQMEEADGVKVLKVSLQSLAKIAEVVFAVGREESDKEVIEQHSISTPMARELERIGLQLNEDDIFDMREVVNYLYGAKTQTAKYSKAKFERLFRELIETYPDTSKATLQTLLRDEDVLQKILKEFSDKTYQAIVALLQPSWAKRIEQYLKDLTVMFKAEVMRRELLWYLKDIDEFSFSLADFIHQVLNEVIDGDKEEYGRMLITTIQYLKITELTSKNDLREALSELKVKYDVRVGNIKPKGQKRQTSLDEKAKTKKTLLEETIYVQNAGLVLIYPFLSRYFNFLGMLEENKFKDEATANRAVLLLQYLATGFSKSPEHELILNKLLCGLPLDTPVPSEIEMTDKEKEISGQMLQAIIQNWKRLNNMTVDNFRGSFILRDGKLEESEKFWQLKVEKKAWDVLLKTLPWGYTMVRLPWMEKIINVEWQA